ncbi:MAG: ribonuclease Y [Acholeplasmatales bacterium]|jgi:ribonuclease Y|nr:ribonuclease Y [Acholeplasmatales bacterium]
MNILQITGSDWALVIVLPVVAILIGIVLGIYIRVVFYNKTIKAATQDKQKILDNALIEANKIKKDTINETKSELQQLKKDHENDLRERRSVVVELEKKAIQKEESLSQRSLNLDKREENLTLREVKINSKKEELDELEKKIITNFETSEKKLLEVGNLSSEEARNIIIDRAKESTQREVELLIKSEYENAKETANSKAKELISSAIQKYASEVVAERTVSTVNLPNDDVKGKIIGREGRNIRTIEALTGVDVIIDDTPDTIVLSGFDPVRREIAKRSLEYLISDGRIHPGRIEEVVEKTKLEVDNIMREKGDAAIFEVNIGKVHPDLIKFLGRLHFRTSYGQNVLKHSIETAFICGKIAVELGENEILARRAGLFHDIGKAIDHEQEGTHAGLGYELATRYHEPKEVLDGIISHHGEKPATTIIGVLVAASDAISAARPGARNENLENYIKRLENLEKIATDFGGVDKAYAISAGREIRVIVKPEDVDDIKSFALAKQIKEKIEATMVYPGTITVTVIRETRAKEIAK